MKSVFLSICFITSFIVKSQSQISDYKYIVVAKKFNGFKKENQYKTSTLVKNLFTERGFTTVFEDTMPADLKSNRCLGLYVNLIAPSSSYTIKASLVLKDCMGKEVFVTKQGNSKQKIYEAAYSEALHEAMKSFDGIIYSYKPKVDNEEKSSITVSFRNDIKKLAHTSNLNTLQKSMVKQEATLENQTYKDMRPISSNIKKVTADDKNKTVEPKNIGYVNNAKVSSKGVLYVQEMPNGYHLVDSTLAVQFILYKASLPNVYMAKSESKNGVVYEKNKQWYFEYYSDGEFVIKELNIKF